MKKIIKKYGDSLVINFTKDERKLYRLKEGDVIDVEINKPIDYQYMKRKAKKDGDN